MGNNVIYPDDFIMSPKVDFAFKELMTNDLVRKGFLSAVLNIKDTNIKKHYLISSGIGIALLLITYLVVKYINFGIYLPISATMAIIALPLMAILFLKKD